MNEAEHLFLDFLNTIDMRLVNYEDGYGLIDLQGANLGDIEQERFLTAEEMVDRLNVYIEDSYIVDLEEEYTRYFDTPDDEAPYHSAEDWCEMFKLAKYPASMASVFIAEHLHQFKVLDMIVNHIDEVDLSRVEEVSEPMA